MRIFSKYSDSQQGWFRVFGVGISWKDSRKVRLLFSERIGRTSYLKIRHTIFKFI